MKRKKSTLLAVAMSLIPWAFQQLIQGNLYTGGTAFVFGLAAITAYEHLQIEQVPQSADDLKDLSEQIGSALEEQLDRDTEA